METGALNKLFSDLYEVPPTVEPRLPPTQGRKVNMAAGELKVKSNAKTADPLRKQ